MCNHLITQGILNAQSQSYSKIAEKTSYNNRAIISIHPFSDNFDDNLVFLSFYRLKTMETEKGRERIITSCEYERESCQKVVAKWLYKYHFS